MTPAPSTPAVTPSLYEELGVPHVRDEEFGWPFLLLIGAVGQTLTQVHDVVRGTSERDGWVDTLDPLTAPAFALPWLGQFAGLELTDALTEQQQRDRILTPSPYRRGTPSAMREAIQATLTGTKQVQIVEQFGGSEYAIAVYTLSSETPDTAVSEAAAMSQKPAGLILTFSATDGVIIDQGTLTIDASTGDIDDAVLGSVT